MISIGMSNATQEFRRFQDLVADFGGADPAPPLRDLNVGVGFLGVAAEIATQPLAQSLTELAGSFSLSEIVPRPVI